MWFVFAFSFALISSLSAILAKLILRQMNEYGFLFFINLLTVPFLLLIILYFYQIPKVDALFFVYVFVGLSISTVGSILSVKALKFSEISLVSPISAFNPVFTSIISYIFLKETIGYKGTLGIITIVIGTYFLQASKSRKDVLGSIKALFKHKGVQMFFAAYFLWSITPIFEKSAILRTEPSVPPFVSLVGLIGASFIYFIKLNKDIRQQFVSFKLNLKTFVLLAILGALGQAAAFIAFSLTNLGFATAIFKLSIFFSVLFGGIFFKERNLKQRLVASGIMLIGVFLIVS
jgi:uncharacterized membrane protein